jgi:hypothetical protein
MIRGLRGYRTMTQYITMKMFLIDFAADFQYSAGLAVFPSPASSQAPLKF